MPHTNPTQQTPPTPVGPEQSSERVKAQEQRRGQRRLQCHEISFASLRRDQNYNNAMLERVLQLARNVFGFDTRNGNPARQLLMATWMEKLAKEDARVLYVTKTQTSAASDAADDEGVMSISSLSTTSESRLEPGSVETPPSPTAADVFGYFFAYRHVQPCVGYATMHLWLAGVAETCRGLGVFPFLLEALKTHAGNCGLENLSVCTYPKRWMTMYGILTKTGWEEVAWLEGGEKVVMVLKT